MRMAALIHNVSPIKHNDNKSPYEVGTLQVPDVSQYRTFGCRVLVKDPNPHGKFTVRTWEGVHVGPAKGGDGYRIYNPKTEKICNSRDVYFIEEEQRGNYHRSPIVNIQPRVIDNMEEDNVGERDEGIPLILNRKRDKRAKVMIQPLSRDDSDDYANPMPTDSTSLDHTPLPHHVESENESDDNDDELLESADGSSNPSDDDSGGDDDDEVEHEENIEQPSDSSSSSDDEPTPPLNRNRRVPQPQPAPTRTLTREGRGQRAQVPYWQHSAASASVPKHPKGLCAFHAKDVDDISKFRVGEIEEPKSYNEAITSPQSSHWMKAMKTEIEAITRLGTYRMTRIPSGRKPIGCKWVYKIKWHPNGTVSRFKARLVAQGFTQRRGTDFHETFAPVARMTSQRLVIAIAATENLNLYTIDVENAYLNGEIDTKLYMKQPQGFEHPDYSDTKIWVWELLKGLYGLKQAGNIWHTALRACIVELGFKRTSNDLCVYIIVRDGSRIAMTIHVDDFLVATTDTNFRWLIMELSKHFSIKYQAASLCLSMKIDKIPNGYAFGQQHYLETVLSLFDMQDCKPVPTPLTKGEVNALVIGDLKNAEPLDAKEHNIYRQIVGKLMYAMVGSRPDIAHALSLLGRYAAAPNTYHLGLAKRVLAYVKHTINYRLHYCRDSSGITPVLHGYVDSDYANSEDRKSTTGFCYYYGSCLFDWCSKKQSVTATSTTVAEYIALYEATTQAIAHRITLNDLQLTQTEATVIREDNQTAIKLADDEATHKRTKHIDVKYHYSKEQRELGNIKIVYISTLENVADMFTKQLDRDKFLTFCKQLGLYA